MLSVILIWCYMLVTAFGTGYGVLRAITSRVPYRIRHVDSYLMCGLVCVTVYAEFFSLFDRVGLLANLILCGACALILWRGRRVLGGKLRELLASAKGKRKACVYLFLFLLFAYGTSRGMIHYDTGLYHAQSIRWLEEYGVVKGLGNLHCRLAYNSSSFALSALYSMSFLGGQSYHCCAGLLALIIAGICLEIGDSLRAGRLKVSDFARVMGIYYLVIIFDEIISPASDYFMVLIAFYIVIRWLDLLESGEKIIVPYALLCVMGVFLVTVKLSAALILLLTLQPAYYLLKERRGRETAGYLLLGCLVALPYLIRNVIISGWLVYPFTGIDWFSVSWKIPKGLADYDAREIQVWGRGYTDVSQFDRSIRDWLPEWFQALENSDKLLVLAAAFSVCVLLLYGVGMLWRLLRSRKRGGAGKPLAEQWHMLLVQGTMAGSFLFWLGTSPLIRYGCVYVYLTSAVVLGGLYDRLVNRTGRTGAAVQKSAALWRRSVNGLCMAAVTLLILYKACALGREIMGAYVDDYWLAQKDYENYEVIPYELNGVTFYYPAQGDQVGYEGFPSSPARAEIGFLGQEIKDGFYSPD